MAQKEFYSIEVFEQVVRELVKEVIKEEMMHEFGIAPPIPAQAKPGQQPMKSGDGIKMTGTNMTLNQYMDAIAKEPNIQKKAEMTKKALDVMNALGLSGGQSSPAQGNGGKNWVPV